MANRYNNYTKVNYVNLSLDAWQMAAGAVEQENLSQLQSAKSVYDGLQNIEASYNPDIELKGQLLNSVQERINDLSKKNLKGADALMQLNRIVNDRGMIDKLSDIYANTTNYKSALASEKKYQEDSGNDINIQRGIDERAAYNKLGAKDFRSGVMAGYSPNKFVDIVGDMQKVLEHAKADGWTEDVVSGNWISRDKTKKLSLDKLLEQSGMMLNDPKYASQLRNLSYYGLREFGGATDAASAIKKYNGASAEALNQRISEAATHLSSLQAEQKQAAPKDKPKYDKIIEDGQRAIAQLSAERDGYISDTRGGMYQKDIRTTLARAASAPFAFSETEHTLSANPYALAKYKSDLSFGNAMALYRKKRKDKQDDAKQKAIDEWQNTPIPTVQSLKIKDTNGNDIQTAAVQFDKKGGFDINAISETIGAAYQLGDGISGDKIPLNDKDAGGKKMNIVNKLKTGEFQGFYSPATKEYIITSPYGQTRVKADLHTQRVMDPLYQLYNPQLKTGVTKVDGVSLDGKNPYTIYAYKPNDQTKDPYLYSPTSQPVDITNIKDEDFMKMVGINVSKGAVYKHVGSEGVFVAVELIDDKLINQDGSSAMGATMQMNDILTVDEFEEAKAKGMIKAGSKYQFLYKSGNSNIQAISPVDGGAGGSILAQQQMRYETRPGGGMRNVRGKSLYVKAKSNTGTLEEDNNDEENLLNQSNDEQ